MCFTFHQDNFGQYYMVLEMGVKCRFAEYAKEFGVPGKIRPETIERYQLRSKAGRRQPTTDELYFLTEFGKETWINNAVCQCDHDSCCPCRQYNREIYLDLLYWSLHHDHRDVQDYVCNSRPNDSQHDDFENEYYYQIKSQGPDLHKQNSLNMERHLLMLAMREKKRFEKLSLISPLKKDKGTKKHSPKSRVCRGLKEVDVY